MRPTHAICVSVTHSGWYRKGGSCQQRREVVETKPSAAAHNPCCFSCVAHWPHISGPCDLTCGRGRMLRACVRAWGWGGHMLCETCNHIDLLAAAGGWCLACRGRCTAGNSCLQQVAVGCACPWQPQTRQVHMLWAALAAWRAATSLPPVLLIGRCNQHLSASKLSGGVH